MKLTDFYEKVYGASQFPKTPESPSEKAIAISSLETNEGWKRLVEDATAIKSRIWEKIASETDPNKIMGLVGMMKGINRVLEIPAFARDEVLRTTKEKP